MQNAGLNWTYGWNVDKSIIFEIITIIFVIMTYY